MMIKKLFYFILIFTMLFSLTACTKNNDEVNSSNIESSTTVDSSVPLESSVITPQKVQANEFSSASSVQCGNFNIMIPDSWIKKSNSTDTTFNYDSSLGNASFSISASVITNMIDDTYLSEFTKELIDAFSSNSSYQDFTVTTAPSKVSISSLDSAYVFHCSYFYEQPFTSVVFVGGSGNHFIYLMAVVASEASNYVYDDDINAVIESISYTQPDTTAVQESTVTNDPSVPQEYKSALAKAKIYCDNIHMSKAGIYDQLTSEYGENFSAEAAQYAVDHIQADWKQNALKQAKNYSDNLHMSKAGIYDQLTSEYGEQFTPEEAQYAIDNLQADWKANALERAKSYQESMDMTPAAIRDQLVSEYGEQFTPEEADYAIENLPH